ncbi:hypothetical protein GALMADRAFT_251098 [Galerina marginata CBS 339.88]|uniref:Uncharacterized protein n=1 Tax=Galerina marginata (strain CBS 339.88) TaxID=685588 RepID=A0A067STU9_GALM3|nr:hypothetical protein GALMADRAFT_251098 [Galerina marginata CBS 339.88]
MDAIKSSIQSLENASTTRKGKTQDVEDAISHLSSTVRLLELSSPSANTFARLGELLRGRVLPLYRISLLPALEYAAAVFRFIHNNKIAPALQSKEVLKASWENLAASIFSGILDFLDESTNSRQREIVASAVFPLLCPIFFCQTPGSAVEFDGNLSSAVYQLLMTTTELHGQNAGKLRDQDIGSKRLGFTILQTKELLAMESLLELFAVLVPPVKHGRERRTQFINEVFDSSIFSCSDRIVQCLESIASPDWSVTALEIMNTLAESDISFPQPFEAFHLAVNGEQLHGISLFYVDKSKFIANLEKDGQIDTFHLPFSTIRRLSISSSHNGEVQITVRVTEPPVFGDKPITAVGEISVSWTLKQIRMHKFGKVLKSRNLTVQAPTSKKLSKTEEIVLDFSTTNQAPTQNKAQSLSQLWTFGDLPTRSGQLPTSPLVPSLSVNLSCETGLFDDVDPPRPTGRPTTVLLDPSGNFSFEPHAHQKGINGAAAKAHERSTDPHSSDEISQPKSRPNKFNRRIITISDDDEYASPILPKLQQLRENGPVMNASDLPDTKLNFTVEDGLVAPVSPNAEKDPRPKQLSFKPEMPLPPVGSTGCIDQPMRSIAGKVQNLANDDDCVIDATVEKSKKRSAQETEDKSSTLHGVEKRPVKRPRLEPPTRSLIAPTRPYQTKQYGRRGLNTSPELSTPAVDFDEPPRPEALRPVKEASKSRASAMKAKNGKPIPRSKAKRAPKKKAVVQDKDLNKDLNSKDDSGLSHPVKIDPDLTLVNPSDNLLKSSTKDVTVQHRRSARVANTTASNLKKSEVAKALIKKPRKAPWEDSTFMDNGKLSSDHANELSDPVEDPIKTSDPATSTESEMPRVQPVFLDDNYDLYTGTFSEYFEPTKTGTSSPGHVPLAPTSKSIMIDLTHDNSPKQRLQLERTSMGSRRSLRGTTESFLRHEDEQADVPVNPLGTFHTKKTKSSTPFSPKPAIQQGTSPSIAPPKAVEDSRLPFLRFRDDINKEVLTEKLKSSANLPPKPRFQQMISPLPISDVKVTKSPLPPYRGNENMSTNRIERLTPPPHPDVEDDQLKPMPSASFAPHLNSSNHRWDKPEARARNPEAPSGKHSRGQENRGPNLRQQHQRPKKVTVQLEPEEQPMDRVVDIINQINEAIIHKVERRFDGVTEELHAGQRIILEGTANVLQEMCTTSSRHFNDMVKLDQEYRTHCTKISNGLHDYRKSAEQLSQCFKGIIDDHNHRSLAKRLPTTLFPKIPSIILNPKIRL